MLTVADVLHPVSMTTESRSATGSASVPTTQALCLLATQTLAPTSLQPVMAQTVRMHATIRLSCSTPFLAPIGTPS